MGEALTGWDAVRFELLYVVVSVEDNCGERVVDGEVILQHKCFSVRITSWGDQISYSLLTEEGVCSVCALNGRIEVNVV